MAQTMLNFKLGVTNTKLPAGQCWIGVVECRPDRRWKKGPHDLSIWARVAIHMSISGHPGTPFPQLTPDSIAAFGLTIPN